MKYKLAAYKDDKLELRINDDEIEVEFYGPVNNEDIDFAFNVVKYIADALKEGR